MVNCEDHNIPHLTETLAAICQESAEKGDMPIEVYADMFELIRFLLSAI